jgi:hypothetical protein
MVTVSTGGDGGVPGAAKAQSLRHKRAATKIADEQTERFIMVYLLKTFELRNTIVCDNGTKGLQIRHSRNLSHAYVVAYLFLLSSAISEFQIKKT